MKKFINAVCGRVPNKRRYGFPVIVLLLGMLGTFLRLYLIGDQIVLDDEWHAFLCAAAHPLSALLARPFVGANCAPVNAYCWIILHTVGWSEFWIRLPGLLSGILALFVFPFIVKKAHGRPVAVIFSIFLALSPFLTYHSRVFRPYSELVFLLFTAIYAANFWLLSGKARYQWIYILSAVTAVYFQPIAMATVFAPLAAGGIGSVFGKWLFKKFSVPEIRPSWMDIVLTGGAVLIAAMMILQPSVITDALSRKSVPTAETVKQFVLLLFGTSSLALNTGLLFFCAVGAIALFRQSLLWGAGFLLLLVAHGLIFVVAGSEGIDVTIVLARYAIILFPLSFVLAALGLNAGLSTLNTLIKLKNPALGEAAVSAAALILFILLLITSPLWNTYAAPNNFTNQVAFQESYDPLWQGEGRWVRSSPAFEAVPARPPDMPAFYRNLPAKTRCLIEYPMMLGNNYYYYYQRQHQKRMIAGYTGAVLFEPPHKNHIYGNQLINQVLREVKDETRIRFKNMVNIFDSEAVCKTGADYLVVHRDLMNEFDPGSLPTGITKTPDLRNCTEQLSRQYGKPVYEDRNLIVFDISSRKGDGVTSSLFTFEGESGK